MKTISEVVRHHLCSGCGACAYVYGYKMIDRQLYGRRPKKTENIIEENQKIDFCPGFISDRRLLKRSQNQTRRIFNEWGPVYSVFSGYAADENIRFKASSGGIITAISIFMLESGRAEGVLQTTADVDKPYLNKTVYNTESEQIISASGSRYAPASPCEKLQEVKTRTSSVVVGKPCDINAVTMLCKNDPELEDKIAAKLSIFCAGVPSTQGTFEMLGEMGVASPDDIKSLRYRGMGWPGMAEAVSADPARTYKPLEYSISWGKILVRYKQWRCKICVDKTGQFADIAVGDSWNIIPTGVDPGNSLIICRSKRGQEIVESAIKSGCIIAERRSINDISISQKNLLKAKGEVWGRINALRLAGVGTTRLKGYNLFSLWLRYTSFFRKIGSFYGTFRRIKKYKLRYAEKENKQLLRD